MAGSRGRRTGAGVLVANKPPRAGGVARDFQTFRKAAIESIVGSCKLRSTCSKTGRPPAIGHSVVVSVDFERRIRGANWIPRRRLGYGALHHLAHGPDDGPACGARCEPTEECVESRRINLIGVAGGADVVEGKDQPTAAVRLGIRDGVFEIGERPQYPSPNWVIES